MGDLIVGHLNISNLTDLQLYRKFEELGEPIGPVIGSTRKFYEKRMYNLLMNGTRKPNTEDSDVDVISEEAEPQTFTYQKYEQQWFENSNDQQIPTIRARTKQEILASLPREPMRHSVSSRSVPSAPIASAPMRNTCSHGSGRKYFAYMMEFVVVALLCFMGYYFYNDMKELSEEEQRQAALKMQIDALNND